MSQYMKKLILCPLMITKTLFEIPPAKPCSFTRYVSGRFAGCDALEEMKNQACS